MHETMNVKIEGMSFFPPFTFSNTCKYLVHVNADLFIHDEANICVLMNTVHADDCKLSEATNIIILFKKFPNFS
jgi:hypothetical protein